MRGRGILSSLTGYWLGCLSLGTTTIAHADDRPFATASVSDETLDEVRGGFEMPSNLKASLTLERSAYVNGTLVVSRSVSIPDIANMTEDQATALAAATGTLVIQNGPNNAFNAANLGAASTVIQNTLNDQHLVTLTTLSVDVNSLGAFRELNFQGGLQDSLTIPGVR
jgi:hypothetical protein